MQNGYLILGVVGIPTGWFHLEWKYTASELRMDVYFDGIHKGSDVDLDTYNHYISSGHLVVGKRYTNTLSSYPSLVIDELRLTGN